MDRIAAARDVRMAPLQRAVLQQHNVPVTPSTVCVMHLFSEH